MDTRVATSKNDRLERSDLLIEWGAVTHVGKVRAVNEDSFLATPGMWVVADGMGGHSAGRAASEIMINAAAECADGEPLTLADVPSVLERANQVVRQRALAEGYETMGTTVCGVALVDNGGEDALLVFNVGDSRCYEVVADGDLVQLTTDHSYVQELVERGKIAPEEARSHPNRNVVSRAIGIEDTVAADFIVLPRRSASRLLLCSDGVSGELTDEQIAEILVNADTPADASELLLKEVMSGQARDNATAVVLDISWTMSDPTPDGNGVGDQTTIPKAKRPSPGAPQSDGPGEASAVIIDEVPGFIAPEADTRTTEQLVDRVPGVVPTEEDEAE